MIMTLFDIGKKVFHRMNDCAIISVVSEKKKRTCLKPGFDALIIDPVRERRRRCLDCPESVKSAEKVR